MQAAVYESFGGKITVQTVDKPRADEGSIVVKIKACGVCRSDWHGWKGHDGDIKGHGLPFVPGHEFSGLVSEVGEGVERLKVGDRVHVPFILSCGECRECTRGRATICEDQKQPGFTQWGSFAEFVRVPRADRNVHLLPEKVSFEAAASLGCRFTTAYRAVVQQGKLKRGQTVIVFGCGGVGLSCVAVAVAGGARVIAVDTSSDALTMAKQQGASDVVQVTSSSKTTEAESGDCGEDPALLEHLKKLTNGVGGDITVDAAGFSKTCVNAVFSARRGGRVVQVGLPLGHHANPRIPMARVAAWELELIGSHGMCATEVPALLQQVSDGKLRPQDLITEKCSLTEGAQVLMSMDGASPVGVVMITEFASVSAREK